METQAKKPTCKLTGTDGNVFALAGLVIRALKKAGQTKQASEVSSRLMACKSYDDALAMFCEYVDAR